MAPVTRDTLTFRRGSSATGDLIESVLNPAGPVSRAENAILWDASFIMLVIAIPTIATALWFAWRYRATNTRVPYLPDWDYSGRIELVVWSIPTFVILFLGGVIWIGSHQLDPARRLSAQRALELQVISLDWRWLFIYPELGIATMDQLVVPTGQPLHLSLTSASVMNTFFVPRLGSMIYTMNGMRTQLNLQADEAGDFLGESTMFSGDGFYNMRFVFRAIAPADFNSWVSSMRQQRLRLDSARYGELMKPGTRREPVLFGSAQPGLFDAVVAQELPPAPGPNNREDAPRAAAPGR